MIFQDPRAHVNPVRRIGDFMTEALRTNLGVPAARGRASGPATMLDQVGIDDGERRLRQYPHELSGGMLQRVMIAAGAADRAAAAARRRADHRAGRHHPGRGDGDPGRPAPRVRPGDVVHHPRPGSRRRDLRPHRGDVRRADRRDPRVGAAALPTRCTRTSAALAAARPDIARTAHRLPRSAGGRCRRSRRRTRSARSRPAARTRPRSAGRSCLRWSSWTAGCSRCARATELRGRAGRRPRRGEATPGEPSTYLR